MATERHLGRLFARINLLIYLGGVLVSSYLSAPSIHYFKILFLQPVSNLPPKAPFLVLLGLLLAVLFFSFLAARRVISRERPSTAVSGMFYLGLSLLLMARLSSSYSLGHPVEPSIIKVREKLQAVSENLRSHLRVHEVLPDDMERIAKIAEPRPTISPFSSHGTRLTFSLIVEAGIGPVLAAHRGDLAASIYCTVSRDRRQFWLTAIVLDGSPTGQLIFLDTEEGRPCVLSTDVFSCAAPKAR